MLNVMVIGLGPIGLAAARGVEADGGMRLVGLVDTDPQLLGKSFDGLPPDLKVVTRHSEVPETAVAIVCTTSHFDKISPLLRGLIERRVRVVTSCEEMAWPAYRHQNLAAEIDTLAKQCGSALVGTGVNPGFVMDLLPIVLSSMMTQVASVKCTRIVNASTRRKPLQKKVGAAMSESQFRELAAARAIGHQGIGESVAMIAAGLGRTVLGGAVRETLDPVIAQAPCNSALGQIQMGQVRGMRNTATWSGDGLSIHLDLTMAVGEADPHDAIELDGSRPLSLRINGGTPGDSATVAALVNVARSIVAAPAGLHTMLSLPNAGSR